MLILILIHPSASADASADASAVKSAGFFQYTGQILLESPINKVCVPIVTFWKGYLIRLNPKMFIFYHDKSAVHRFEVYKTFL